MLCYVALAFVSFYWFETPRELSLSSPWLFHKQKVEVQLAQASVFTIAFCLFIYFPTDVIVQDRLLHLSVFFHIKTCAF